MFDDGVWLWLFTDLLSFFFFLIFLLGFLFGLRSADIQLDTIDVLLVVSCFFVIVELALFHLYLVVLIERQLLPISQLGARQLRL